MGFDTTQRVTGAVGLLFLAYFAAHTVHKHNQGPKPKQEESLFAASVLSAIPNDPRMPFWVVSQPSKTAYPVDLLLKIRVVNLQDKRASVDSIKVEIMGVTDWIHLVPIPPQGMAFFGGRLSSARQFTVSPEDISEVFQSEMTPGETMEATGFFESSVKPVVPVPTPFKFRITLRDTVDRISVFENTLNRAPGEQPMLGQSSIRLFGELQDFSSFKQERVGPH